MKKLNNVVTILTLFALTALTACTSGDKTPEFTAYKVENCLDYFDYLYADLSAKERGGGIVKNIECFGEIDYRKDEKFQYGLYVHHKKYGQKKIGLATKNAEDMDKLIELNGQSIKMNGDMLIEVPDLEGARFIWKKDL